ncbi:MAG: TatD family hydrolase [Planctomycetes bacterium]|nr:TatD family hydrolase [Planctomycetota bacterium]NUQ33570.1 TatD family hydrolase [Planctomycetaceae bacterium]
MLIDTHAHINFDAYDADRPDMIRRAFDAGVERIVCIGMMPEGGRSALALARQYPGKVYCSVGIHPYDADQYSDQVIAEMETLLREPEMVLCGEMGIDTFKCKIPLDIQKQAFAAQLKLATRANKGVCIHCRDAFPIVREVLETTGVPPRGGFAHCFSDGPEEALAWVKLGFKVSFAGQVTFKNAEKLREAVKALRPEDIVVETDCPYLAPDPHRGKRNEPAYVAHTASKLAAIWDMDVAEVRRITGANARKVLGIG